MSFLIFLYRKLDIQYLCNASPSSFSGLPAVLSMLETPSVNSLPSLEPILSFCRVEESDSVQGWYAVLDFVCLFLHFLAPFLPGVADRLYHCSQRSPPLGSHSLCPFPLSKGRVCDLLFSNRIQQMWCPSMITCGKIVCLSRRGPWDPSLVAFILIACSQLFNGTKYLWSLPSVWYEPFIHGMWEDEDHVRKLGLNQMCFHAGLPATCPELWLPSSAARAFILLLFWTIANWYFGGWPTALPEESWPTSWLHGAFLGQIFWSSDLLALTF